MTLTEKDKENIQKTWALVRVDSVQAGIELFRRFFEANPDYVKVFPFDDCKDLNEILKSSTLKMHAGRVMTALSSIVDNLNDPILFQENLGKIITSHVERNIELRQFENLKMALVGLLIDKLGNDIMNDETKEAWSKAYDVILDTYKKSKENHSRSSSSL
ncbi:cytoglobin-1-like protein [Euroglyphus maynei]|uniref:Cytoglobin-1-like protein n=1 Tax=Euroglyphus maynei TaxID=6958 RepID=A0A1Y3BF01_EURMA|nr:cytoglobin-1-like protein [Euroglyphus maynei]